MKSRLYVEIAPAPFPGLNLDWEGAPNPKTKQADKTIDGPDAKGRPRLVYESPIRLYAMKKPGAERAIMAYTGTLNRSACWSDANGNLLDRDGKGTSLELNLSQPIAGRACRALANLSLHPNRYNDLGTDPIRPIIFDVEGGVMGQNSSAAVKDRRAMYQAYIDAVNAIRAVNINIPVYSFCYPLTQFDPANDVGCEDLEAQLNDLFNGVCYGAYNLDADALSGGTTWFDRLQSFERLIEKKYPSAGKTKMAFINPVQKIYWPQSMTGDWAKYAAKADKPVPLDLWRKQNETLISLGYDRFLWLDDTGCWAESDWKDYVDAL